MNILFIVDPLDHLKAYKDSSVAMLRALARRDHTLYAAEVGDLYVAAGQVSAQVQRLTVSDDNHNWYNIEERAETLLTFFDAIVMRKDPPFDMEYIYATCLLELAEREGVAVVNPPHCLRDFNEKLAILRFPEYTPTTLVSRAPARLQAFIEQEEDVILKPLDGMGGASIFRVSKSDPNRNVIIETLNRFGEATVMAQRYIPAVSEGDKRVLLINGQVVPFALARIPKAGETRGNLAAGGRGVAMPLTAREKAIAEDLAPRLREEGLFLVGLDLIGGLLTEINVTSPTCFVEITEQSGYNVAELFAQQLESLIN